MPFTAGIAKNENDLFRRLVEFGSGWDRLGALDRFAAASGAIGFLRSFQVDPAYYFYQFKLSFLSADRYELYESNDNFATQTLVGTFNVNEAAAAADHHVRLYYEPLATYSDGVTYTWNAHEAGDELTIKVMEFIPVGAGNPDCVPSLAVETGRLAPIGVGSYNGTDQVYNDKVVLICTADGPDAEFTFGVGNSAADLIGGDIGRTLTQGVLLTEPGDGFVGFRKILIHPAANPSASYQYQTGDKIIVYFDPFATENSPSRDYFVVNNVNGVDTAAGVTAATRKFFPYKKFTADEVWTQKTPPNSTETGVPGMAVGDPRMVIVEDTSSYRQGGPYYYAIERRRIDAAPTEEFVWHLHGMRGIAEVPANDATDFTPDLKVFENAWGRNLSDWDTALHPGNSAYADYHTACLHIKGTAIKYWFCHDQGSLRIVIQCGNKVLKAYLGFYEPYDWPDAYSQPIFIGGSGSAAAPRLDQASNYHSNFYDPSSDEDGSPDGTGAAPGVDQGWQKKSGAMVWFGQGGFKRMVNRFKRGVGLDSADFSGNSLTSSFRTVYDPSENIHASLDAIRGYTCQNNMYPWFAAMASKLKPTNGKVTLIKNRIGALVGELDGIYAFCSNGLAGESEPYLLPGDIGVLPVLETYADAYLLRKCVIFPNHDYGENPSQWVAVEFIAQYRPDPLV